MAYTSMCIFILIPLQQHQDSPNHLLLTSKQFIFKPKTHCQISLQIFVQNSVLYRYGIYNFFEYQRISTLFPERASSHFIEIRGTTKTFVHPIHRYFETKALHALNRCLDDSAASFIPTFWIAWILFKRISLFLP